MKDGRDLLALGTLGVHLDVAFTHARASHDVDPEDQEPDLRLSEQPRDHVVASWMTGVQLGATYGLGHRVAVSVALPVRVTVLDATFHGEGGEELDVESIHHRDETIAGLGDLEVGLRFGVVRPEDVPHVALDLRIACTFPTGHVEEDPYALGDAGESHTHTFFGQGAFVPRLGLSLAFLTPNGDFEFGADGQLSLYAGENGYEPPSLGTFSVGYRHGFDVPWLSLALKQYVYVESESFWNGVIAENSGRSDLGLELGFSAEVGAGFSVGFTGRAVYFSVTNGGTFESPFAGTFSLAWSGETL